MLNKYCTGPPIHVQSGWNGKFYWVPSCQKVSEEIFRNSPIRNKNGIWQQCLLTDRNEIINQYRGPSIDTFYQVAVHLTKRFQRRKYLEIDQPETRIAYDDHVCQRIKAKWEILKEELHRRFIPRLRSFAQEGSAEMIF